MAGVSVIFKAVDEISSRFEAMTNAGNKALDSFDTLEKAADQSYSAITDGAERSASAVEQAAQATDYWTDAIGNYDKGAMEAVYSTEELVEMGYKTSDALADAADGLDQASEEMDKLGKETEETTEKSEEFGKESTDAVNQLDNLLATAGIVLALKGIADEFAECSEAAAEFEVNVAKVSTVADTSALSADQLSAQITKLSRETDTNVNEISDSVYNAISAGIATADAIETVGTAVVLAEAGFTSASSALGVLTTAMNAYHMEASELTKVSDSLVMSQNLGVMTIDQIGSSIGKAISTASAYEVDLYNLESAYISLTKSGIGVDESTTYISGMLNELGKASSNVAKVLQEETGKTFGELMASGYTLADALDVVYESVDRNGEAMMNLWGSAEAGKAANAIINQGLDTFNKNLNTVSNSVGATAKAYDIMENTADDANGRLINSMDNLKIAIGEDLNPILTEIKSGFADITEGATDLIEKHPAITAVFTGVTLGLGTLVVGITGYIAVTKIAAVVTATLGTTITASLGPIALAVAAVGAVAAAMIYLADAEDDAEKAQKSLTSSSQDMADELEGLQAQYDSLTEAGEDDTVAAYQLKNQIDELTESFEANKQTIGDLLEFNERLKTTMDEIGASYDETMDSINTSESDAKSLIAQLVSMSETTDLSGTQLEIMQGIVDRLNGSYEGLNLTLDDTNGKLNMSVESLWKAVSDSAEEQKAQANMDALIDYLGQYQDAQTTYQEANETMNDAWKKYQEMEDQWKNDHPIKAYLGKGAEMNWDKDLGDQFDVWEQAKEATSGAKENFEALEESIRSCYEQMGYSTEEIDSMMAELAMASASAEDFAASLEQTEEVLVSAEDAVAEAVSGVSDRLQTLAQDYDDAYAAAQESIEGQYNLWDSIKEVVSMTSGEIQSALQSQIDYWNSYNQNLDTLTEKSSSIEGLSEVLKAVADGSEDSAAMLSGMAQMSDEDLAAMVTQYQNLQKSQDDTATNMADLATDFGKSLDDIQGDMEDAVKNMNMEEEARASANATMDAYISAIKSKTSEVNSALAALTFANSNTPGLNGYAVGTMDAEPGLALVGENGPELVNFGGGEVVYTADETANILGGRDNDDGFVYAPSEETDSSETGNSEKTINLKIEGSGEMKIGGGMSKGDVLNILFENMKDALMGIISQEILEEGDMSYEF